MRLSGVNLSNYERVGGTEAGSYLLAEPGIVLAVPRPGYRQTEDGARASLAEAERLSRHFGEPIVVLILTDEVRDQDRGSRRVWTDEMNPATIRGLGLVGASPMARALGSFFMGLTRPRVPTKLFANLEASLHWARKLRAQAGDEE